MRAVNSCQSRGRLRLLCVDAHCKQLFCTVPDQAQRTRRWRPAPKRPSPTRSSSSHPRPTCSKSAAMRTKPFSREVILVRALRISRAYGVKQTQQRRVRGGNGMPHNEHKRKQRRRAGRPDERADPAGRQGSMALPRWVAPCRTGQCDASLPCSMPCHCPVCFAACDATALLACSVPRLAYCASISCLSATSRSSPARSLSRACISRCSASASCKVQRPRGRVRKVSERVPKVAKHALVPR